MTESLALSSITDTFAFHEIGEDSDLFEDLSISVFGREKERDLLLKTFHKVIETKRSATVIVHGKSGMGKTSLVDMLREPIINSRGIFCAGKYFQNTAMQEPYSAIMAAFSDLCDLMLQSEHCDEDRRTEIQRVLGTDGYILTKVISNIGPFLSEDHSFIDFGNDSSLAKFNIACKKFLQAMSGDGHPVVLFIDDIQWMDEGSRQLVEMFLRMNEKELPNVLFIFAFREEEEDKVVHMLRLSQDLVDIPLLPLDPNAVHQMVSSSLNSSSGTIRELSDLIHRRTFGNPFYIAQFLEAIEYEGLIVFDEASKLWEFDVDAIQSSMMIADDLLDLITRRIERVKSEVQDALKIASLIGYSFSESILMETADAYEMEKQAHKPDNTDRSLQESSVALQLTEAVQSGFIEKTKNGFQFCHDKIQAAFQSMIDDDNEVALLHHLIGETFLDQAIDEATMYNAAVHMNSAPGFYCINDQLLRLMQINLEAANFCINKSAFAAASALLQDAIGQTTLEQRWSDDFFPYTFKMTELLAKAELVIGNFESCKVAIQTALQMSKSTEMETKFLLLDVEAHMANHEMDESMASARRALDALGVKIPKHVLPRHVSTKYMKIKMLTWRKSDAQLLGLPQMNDERKSTAVRLLLHICTYCFMRDEEDLAVFSALKALEISLKCGLSPTSSTAFAIYALAEVSLGNHTSAYRWGNLALQLLDRLKCKEATCATIGFACTLVSFWKEPLENLYPKLQEAAEIGFDIGDVVYGAYCMSHYFSIQSVLGKNLLDFEASLRRAIAIISEHGQEAMLSWINPTLQFVLNMQSHPTRWTSMVTLTGEAMDEEEFMCHFQRENHTTLLAIALLQKATLACFFGFHKHGADLIDQVLTIGRVAQVSYGRLITLWAGAFTNFGLYVKLGNRKMLRKARHFRQLLEQMVGIGCPDAVTFLAVVKVKELSVKKKVSVSTLVQAYDCLLEDLSKKNRYLQEAMLNEDACYELVRRGCAEQAKSYCDRALDIYENTYCSNGKFQHLLEYSELTFSGLGMENDGINPAARVGTTIVVSDDNCTGIDAQ